MLPKVCLSRGLLAAAAEGPQVSRVFSTEVRAHSLSRLAGDSLHLKAPPRSASSVSSIPGLMVRPWIQMQKGRCVGKAQPLPQSWTRHCWPHWPTSCWWELSGYRCL